jgi:hypothetical protein
MGTLRTTITVVGLAATVLGATFGSPVIAHGDPGTHAPNGLRRMVRILEARDLMVLHRQLASIGAVIRPATDQA